LPPEQITNYRNVTPAADQYSAAATLYQLLTGQILFPTAQDAQEMILNILHKEPARIETHRKDLLGALGSIIHRALAKQPGKRFPDAAAFRAALLPFARGA
jgi:serine/threonine protein kinase